MRKRLGYSIAAAAMIGGVSLGTAGAASAAHCNDNGGPGNSDYAAHVQAQNGNGAHNEGDHKGRSSCQETSPNYTG